MKIPSYFVREEDTYTKSGLFDHFCLTEETGEKLLSLLLQYRVLTPLKPTSSELLFKFSFAQVVNVLRRYGRESEAERYPGGESERLDFSLIAESLALLDDYAEHGLYSTTVSDSEYNGTGEILWDKTLRFLDPFFCNDVPLYLDFHTKRTVEDTNDYVTRLHKLILTECSRLLDDADLLPMFGLSPLRLSVERRGHFGPEDHILQRLRAELDIQFDCHKQELLRRLIRFIERRETLATQPLHLYGTTSFETVWEKACARALGNQLHTFLERLPLPAGLHPDYRACITLMNLIKRPEWHLAPGAFPGNGTLTPDIAAFYRHSDETVFLILDAKYYTYANLREKHPGIADIDKQYLYEVAFRPFLKAHGINRVQNIFLLPAEGNSLEYKGYVEFTMLKDLGCENIKIVLVPAGRVFAAYLNETPKGSLAESLLCQVLS